MTTAQARTSLRLTRFFKAPRQKVFEAWTNPELLKRWMGPATVNVVSAQVTPKVGGSYRIEMYNAAAGTQWIASGTFREIVQNEKLVMTWGWERPDRYETLLTVLLADKDGGTELTLIHERFANAEDLGGHEHGWIGSLEKLAGVVGG